jgi:hypothetical protein
VEAIGSWELPDEYYKGAHAANDYSMMTFSTWLRSGILSHRLTKTLFSGPYGLKWAVLILLCVYSSLQVGGRKRKAAARGSLDVDNELAAVEADVNWLCDELESSSLYLLCSRADEMASYTLLLHENIMFQRAEHHLMPIRDVNLFSFIRSPHYLHNTP